MGNKVSATQTRRRTAHFALGQPSDLPNNMLPLESDIFNKYRKMKEENCNATQKDMAKALAEEVMNFWVSKVNLPTVELYSIQKKIVDVIARGRNILKIPKERREKLLDELDQEENSEETEATKKGQKKKKT